jgi:hypothetical protein
MSGLVIESPGLAEFYDAKLGLASVSASRVFNLADVS